MRIALAQINSTVGNLSGNKDKISRFIQVAEEKGVDILVFPELCLTGYPPEDLLLKPHFLEECQSMIRDMAKFSNHMLTLIGFPMSRSGLVYNACAGIYSGKIVGIYAKRRLPNYGVFDERRYFEAGQKPLLFQYGQTRVGVTICEDIWGEGGPAKEAVSLGAELIINLSASPYHFGKVKERKRLVRDFALKNKAAIVYCNQVGGQDELIFDGGSFICQKNGQFILSGPLFKEELLLGDIEFKKKATQKKATQREATQRVASIPEKKAGTWIKLELESQKKKVPILPSLFKDLEVEEEVYSALVLGIQDYVRKNGFKNVTVGLSGGIDSALVSVLACDALGAENVFAVTMPSPFSSPETIKDAKIMAHNLGLKLLVLPIEALYRSYLDLLAGPFKGKKLDITEENIQARIRGNILMALSNKFGWLVLTTGNKSELSVGYATLYGDMAGGFAVLKDVYKTLVYRLVNFRNKKAGKELIPATIIQRPPSAELAPGQKDRDTLPPYSTLDKILMLYIEKDLSGEGIIKKGFSSKIVKDIIQRVDRNEYKRRQSPPGIKITPKAFGKDRRMPITNRYVEE